MCIYTYFYYYYYYVKFSTGIFPGEKYPVKSYPETSDFQHLSEDMCWSELLLLLLLLLSAVTNIFLCVG